MHRMHRKRGAGKVLGKVRAGDELLLGLLESSSFLIFFYKLSHFLHTRRHVGCQLDTLISHFKKKSF